MRQSVTCGSRIVYEGPEPVYVGRPGSPRWTPAQSSTQNVRSWRQADIVL